MGRALTLGWCRTGSGASSTYDHRKMLRKLEYCLAKGNRAQFMNIHLFIAGQNCTATNQSS